MKTISISTHKGGPGKTTTAINLSSYLARKQKKVVLVDLDPQGHATMGLGVDIELSSPTIADSLQDKNNNIKKAVIAVNDYLSIIPANIRLARIAESLYGAVKREERLTTILKTLEPDFDYCIIDCPPSLGTLTANALTCADWVLVPCEMGARAPDGLVDLLEMVYLLKGENFNAWRILLNKFDSRKTITNEAVMKGLQNYKDKILNTSIGALEPINQAQIAGQDIFRYEPKGKASEYYESLGNEFLAILENKIPIEAI